MEKSVWHNLGKNWHTISGPKSVFFTLNMDQFDA